MARNNLNQPIRALKSGPLSGIFYVPGDKSISHRSLLLGALAVGKTKIRGLLQSGDVMRTAAMVQALGATITMRKNNLVEVAGAGVGALLEPDDIVDFGNAGTGVRLAVGMVGTYDFAVTFTGDGSLRSRPMGRIIEPLVQMGAEITARSGNRLPLTIRGSATPIPIRYEVPVPSAQVKSAILLAALNTPGTTTVIERVFTRDHTENMLAGFGADIEVNTARNGTRTIAVDGRPDLEPQNIEVPADPSSAAFPIVAALIVEGSDLKIDNVMLNPSRTGLLTTLREMGGDIEITNERTVGGELIGDIRVRHSVLKGVDVPAERAPSMIDEYPVLAIAAAFAEGDTLMSGLHELTIKETNRLAAMAAGLTVNNVRHRTGEDWLQLTGCGGKKANGFGGGSVATHLDHRIAMSFLVLGMAAEHPVIIDDGAPIDTSFPGFCETFVERGGSFEMAEVEAG